MHASMHCRAMDAYGGYTHLATPKRSGGEGGQSLPELFDGRKMADPEELLLEGADGPFGHPIALGLAHEGWGTGDAKAFDLALEVVRHVVRPMVVPQDQAEGRIRPDAAEVPGDALTDRFQRLPALSISAHSG